METARCKQELVTELLGLLLMILVKRNLLVAGSLESAYSSIWGSHEIWGQDLGTFMISRPI